MGEDIFTLEDIIRATRGLYNNEPNKISVEDSSLPSGAATEAKQDTAITRLDLLATEAKQDTAITRLDLLATEAKQDAAQTRLDLLATEATLEALRVLNAGSATLTGAIQNVTTAGTRVQLPDIPCREITIIAKRTNNGFIYAGGDDVSSAVYGAELEAKDSMTLTVANANQVWIDASVSGEGISYVTV